MLEVKNLTLGDAFSFEKEGALGELFSVVVVKYSYDIKEGELRLSNNPPGITLADRYFGEPEKSSLEIEGDLVLQKPGTDLWLTGKAKAPSNKPERGWTAEIQVGPIGAVYALCGPRYWEFQDPKGWTLTQPEEVTSVELRYENAFGGLRQTAAAELEAWPSNPVGKGYLNVGGLNRKERYGAPSILFADDVYTKPEHLPRTAPLGPINRWWKERYKFAGTYDKAWEDTWKGKRPFPCLPADFNTRFCNAAHPTFVATPHLKGGEPMVLSGFGSDLNLKTHVPTVAHEALIRDGSRAGELSPFLLDTVHVDLTNSQVHFVWRLTLPASLDASSALVRLADLEK
ncbi:MAG: DUF2169 domain-containing protein [Polyangiaceae bacterium]|nr:DUF2169 domain-containing protein [Polyangiaceae bacterium]